MSLTAPAHPAVSLHAVAVVLKLDGVEILFEQGEVRTLEAAIDVDTRHPALLSHGWIQHLQEDWPVYSLSGKLDLLATAPASRMACALLAVDSGYLGLLCDDAYILRKVDSAHVDLPPAMMLPSSPIQGVLPYEGRLLCRCNASLLAARIKNALTAHAQG